MRNHNYSDGAGVWLASASLDDGTLTAEAGMSVGRDHPAEVGFGSPAGNGAGVWLAAGTLEDGSLYGLEPSER